jgi:hypothetical protein
MNQHDDDPAFLRFVARSIEAMFPGDPFAKHYAAYLAECGDAAEDQAEEVAMWEEAEAEAARRGCEPEDLVDLWLDQADEPADFDDHDTEHDPRDCQGILDELGMREVPVGHLSQCDPPTPYTDEP